MSTPTHLEKQILATVIYYNILDYPLTGFEVFLYLVKNCHCEGATATEAIPQLCANNLNTGLPRNVLSDDRQNIPRNDSIYITEVIDLLNSSEYLKKYLREKLGFYYLKKREKTVIARESQRPKQSRNYTQETLNTGLPRRFLSGNRQEAPRNDIIHQRLNRKKLADQKWKKIKKIFWIMQITPFMKMVLVSGSLALGNSRKESDVDLIITAKKGRIWMVRTFVTLLTSVLGVRRYKNKTENKICLNHYITDKSLRIPFESLYNAQSYLHLINVYNDKKDKELFKKFQEENKWIRKYVSNYELAELGGFRSIKRSKMLNSISKFSEFILAGKMWNYLENVLSKIQSNKIRKDPLYEKGGGRITINNDQLEFHPNSHEANIIPEFNRRMKELDIYEFANQKDSGLTHPVNQI